MGRGKRVLTIVGLLTLALGAIAAWQYEEILARWRGYKVVWMEEGVP